MEFSAPPWCRREPLPLGATEKGAPGGASEHKGFEAQGQRPAPCGGMSGREARAQDRLGPSFGTHQDPRIQEQQELQSRREWGGPACHSPQSPGAPAEPRQSRLPGSALHPPGAPGTQPLLAEALQSLSSLWVCPRLRAPVRKLRTHHLLSPSGSGSATEPADARQCRGSLASSDPLSRLLT